MLHSPAHDVSSFLRGDRERWRLESFTERTFDGVDKIASTFDCVIIGFNAACHHSGIREALQAAQRPPVEPAVLHQKESGGARLPARRPGDRARAAGARAPSALRARAPRAGRAAAQLAEARRERLAAGADRVRRQLLAALRHRYRLANGAGGRGRHAAGARDGAHLDDAGAAARGLLGVARPARRRAARPPARERDRLLRTGAPGDRGGRGRPQRGAAFRRPPCSRASCGSRGRARWRSRPSRGRSSTSTSGRCAR